MFAVPQVGALFQRPANTLNSLGVVWDSFQMAAAGQFRNHAAVGVVDLVLTRNDFRELLFAAGAVKRHGRVVAGTLYA